ncbi:MAG: hypothetical protein H6684_03805 [Deltaproteobacteria bacterium]|nr:hypothetical protein [bacterium]MCB9477798.1 hypothetical protein [Deltaproteobacteria bacterium]MCB9478957.1 hypothetical protein [Deltaproteobacteria bacterium]MCB9487838.1 hypothetical protein [Deltaproteobacteria bacterium]
MFSSRWVVVPAVALVLGSLGMNYGEAAADEKSLTRQIHRLRTETLRHLKMYLPPKDEELAAARKILKPWLAAWARGGRVPTPQGFDGMAWTRETIDGRDYALLHEKDNNLEGRGAYLFRRNTPRPSALVLMAPHSFFDQGTGRIAVKVFWEGRADALLVNTAHRYTGARKDKVDVRGSDFAHDDQNYYFVVYEELIDAYPSGLVVQLHGFDGGLKKEKRGGTDVVVSGGTSRGTHGEFGREAAQILTDALPGLKVHAYGDGAKTLGGVHNVHGKDLRDKPNWSFLHLEMNENARHRLRQDDDLRKRLAAALDLIAKGVGDRTAKTK